MNAEEVSKTLGSLGCLILVALAVALGIGAWWMSRSEDDALRTWWQQQPPVTRTAFCGPVVQDPSFNGTASGMAAAVADPDVDVYDAKAFLLDVCFPGSKG